MATLPPTTLVIFGATGDLATRKLLPALFQLHCRSLLPHTFAVVGLSRGSYTRQSYRRTVCDIVADRAPAEAKNVRLSSFCERFFFVKGDFTSTDSYRRLRTQLEAIDAARGRVTNKLFYLAVPPALYGTMFAAIADAELMDMCDYPRTTTRLLVEKPFGSDLQNAKALEAQLCRQFSDTQVFRIDHYLAKDAIENIIALRNANPIIAGLLSNTHVAAMAVRILEESNVAHRAAFYDGIGALRDMGSHLLQMCALVTMDVVSFDDPEGICAARARAIEALVPPHPEQYESAVVRGQYRGYRAAAGVAPHSTTETYLKVRAESRASQWRGVPVVFETGKAVGRQCSEIVVTFKSGDQRHCAAATPTHIHHNTLTMTFAPSQRIGLTLWTKRAGLGFELEKRELVLSSAPAPQQQSLEAYEKVLYDCIVGDSRRFLTAAEVQAVWKFITPLHQGWGSTPLHLYPQGSMPASFGAAPEEAEVV